MNSAFAPCRDIRASRFVKAFWQTEGKPQHRLETILPKGVIEIIFSFQDPVQFSREIQDWNQPTPRCFITGISNTPIHLQVPLYQSFFGVELHPVAAKKLLKVPSGAFLNAIVDLEAINKEFSSLWHRLAEACTFPERVAIMQQWIVQNLRPVHQQEMAISDFLNSPPQPSSVAGLAAQFCYSTRQLHRKTQELFGMSTEALIGYKRYLHALQLLQRRNETLTHIGYDCHYYDQAHFIREFRDYTGLTPGEYRQQKSSLAGHLYQ